MVHFPNLGPVRRPSLAGGAGRALKPHHTTPTATTTTVQWNTDICITFVPVNLMQISVEP